MVPKIFNTVSRFCMSNLTLKLLSLAVALSIWSFTAVSREVHYDLVIPVEMRNIPPGYRVAGDLRREVRFTLYGPSLLIDGARRSNPSIILNLRGTVPGKTIYSHLDSYLKLPEKIRVTRTSPATIEIELTRGQMLSPQGEQQ